MAHPTDPPAADTIEVSVFGKGVGESVLVHLGSGEWLVADSLRDAGSGRPVALDYLEAINVDVTQAVKLAVVTHWHADHTEGMADLVAHATSAEVVFSQALRSSEFQELLGADEIFSPEGSSLSELRAIMKILRERKKGLRPGPGVPKFALENRCLKNTPVGDVYSLSPSDASVMSALEEIRSLLPSEGSPKRKAVAQHPNGTCIVLSIRLNTTVVILGADLEAGRDPTKGWKAIVSSTGRVHPVAHYFKVPHHGSSNADEPSAWAGLLRPAPVAVVTPYRALREPIPTRDDVRRLLTRTNNLYCAGSRTGIKIPSRPSNVQKLVGGKLHVIDGRLGHVRVRFSPSAAPTMEIFGSAERLRAA